MTQLIVIGITVWTKEIVARWTKLGAALKACTVAWCTITLVLEHGATSYQGIRLSTP